MLLLSNYSPFALASLKLYSITVYALFFYCQDNKLISLCTSGTRNIEIHRFHSSRIIANSFTAGGFLVFVRWRLVTAVHLDKCVMRDATIFPVIPHFLADKGIWIFARNVAARADIAPSRQQFFHFHLRILSSGALACRTKKAQDSWFPAGNVCVGDT